MKYQVIYVNTAGCNLTAKFLFCVLYRRTCAKVTISHLKSGRLERVLIGVDRPTRLESMCSGFHVFNIYI